MRGTIPATCRRSCLLPGWRRVSWARTVGLDFGAADHDAQQQGDQHAQAEAGADAGDAEIEQDGLGVQCADDGAQQDAGDGDDEADQAGHVGLRPGLRERPLA